MAAAVRMYASGQNRLFVATPNLVCIKPDNGHQYRESGHRQIYVRCGGLSRSAGGMARTSESSRERSYQRHQWRARQASASRQSRTLPIGYPSRIGVAIVAMVTKDIAAHLVADEPADVLGVAGHDVLRDVGVLVDLLAQPAEPIGVDERHARAP